MEQPKLMQKLRDEIKNVIVDPFRKQNPNSEVKICDIIDYESMNELSYFSMCFNESLRIEPPVTYSSFCFMTESVKIGKYNLRAGD